MHRSFIFVRVLPHIFACHTQTHDNSARSLQKKDRNGLWTYNKLHKVALHLIGIFHLDVRIR